MNRNDELLTLADAANYLQYSRTTMYRIVSYKKIEYSKPGRKILFRKRDLDAYLEKWTVKCKE